MELALISKIPKTKVESPWSLYQNAFPLIRHHIAADLFLRPLVLSDLNQMCDFLCNNPEMTWTRSSWKRNNVEYLLNYRLEHYDKFGFGVYGIEKSGDLIGMAGAQVWDESDATVEIVAYLSQEYWGFGIANLTLNWTMSQLAAQHVQLVYAATAKGNSRSKRMIEALGFNISGHGKHFGKDAIFWKQSLSVVQDS